MKKIFSWMLAAILVCGASVVVSSCGSDDDDTTTPPVVTPNTYEVTLSAVLPESAAEFFTLDIEYTVADGRTNKATVKAGDESGEMSEQMKKLYDMEKESAAIRLQWDNKPEKLALFDKLIIKNYTFNVPATKSFSYKATIKVRNDYAQPTGEVFDVIMPFVYLGAKRISGNSQDNSIFTEHLGLTVYGSVETENIGEYLNMFNGEVIVEETRTIN